MATPIKIRSSHGCWTCRLRRKKCDEQKPVCAICAALEITCYYDKEKPEWLDGGIREKQMADEFKAMVRRKANERRERRWTQGITDGSVDDDDHDDDHTADAGMKDSELESGIMEKGSGDHHEDINIPDAVSYNLSQQYDPITSTEPSSIPPSSSSAKEPSASISTPLPSLYAFPDNDKLERELSSTMVYLDYVVPFLFPFYRPCLLESSRGWLLVLLNKNKALFHTALSLASYFYSVVLGSARGRADGTTHSACQRANWTELQTQQGLAIRTLQREMQCLEARGGVQVPASFKPAVHCLESIIQLLEFEIAAPVAGNIADDVKMDEDSETRSLQVHVHVHLNAAAALFTQLLTGHVPPSSSSTPWSSVLSRLGPAHLAQIIYPEDTAAGAKDRRPPIRLWSSDQSAFRFYTAQLIWADILAATATGTAARLAPYHDEVLGSSTLQLQLDEYVGCANWAALALADVAALSAWKHKMRDQGALSAVELVRRASAIEDRVRRGIASLPLLTYNSGGTGHALLGTPPHLAFPEHGLADATAGSGTKMQVAAAAALHTRIYAQATLTYLAVVVSGFQPALPEIRDSVAATVEALRLLAAAASPLCLRTVAWPFAVTGCLAALGGEEQAVFTDLVAGIGPMRVFGSVEEAMRIVRCVWGHRERGCVGVQTWDIATCLGVLGRPALLA
ncbi:fungal-specific transcription factor domain-containing protein [Camillea tinctor]|nr:fungal-specific transcription factor domain-containing protein [Camillea tinctor]